MFKTGLIEFEAVLAVARRHSFRASAVELGMSTSALSSAVAGLEARLGVRLFHRTTRSVSLTEAGHEFLAQVEPAIAQIQGAMSAINDHRATPTGTLRINSSLGAARMIFQPVVCEFLRRHPAMTVDIVTEGRMVDIVGEGFDVGIRPQRTRAARHGPRADRIEAAHGGGRVARLFREASATAHRRRVG